MDIGHLPNPAPSVLINLKAATIRSMPGACGRPKAVSALDRHTVRYAPETRARASQFDLPQRANTVVRYPSARAPALV